MDKDETIIEVLKRLRTDLGKQTFQVVDHWEADLVAVGIASPSNPRILAYISTLNYPEHGYFLELEAPGKSEDLDDYKVIGTWDRLNDEDLKKHIQKHLVIPTSRSEPVRLDNPSNAKK